MTTVRRDQFGNPEVERTVREEKMLELRRQGSAMLLPLTGDGPNTVSCMANIRAFMQTVDDPARYADKVPQWRRDLRAARYADWLAARDAKKP